MQNSLSFCIVGLYMGVYLGQIEPRHKIYLYVWYIAPPTRNEGRKSYYFKCGGCTEKQNKKKRTQSALI